MVRKSKKIRFQEMKEILDKWGFSDFASTLWDNKINSEVLVLTDVHHIRLILHELSFPQQVAFEYHFRLWRHSIKRPLEDDLFVISREDGRIEPNMAPSTADSFVDVVVRKALSKYGMRNQFSRGKSSASKFLLSKTIRRNAMSFKELVTRLPQDSSHAVCANTPNSTATENSSEQVKPQVSLNEAETLSSPEEPVTMQQSSDLVINKKDLTELKAETKSLTRDSSLDSNGMRFAQSPGKVQTASKSTQSDIKDTGNEAISNPFVSGVSTHCISEVKMKFSVCDHKPNQRSIACQTSKNELITVPLKKFSTSDGFVQSDDRGPSHRAHLKDILLWCGPYVSEVFEFYKRFNYLDNGHRIRIITAVVFYFNYNALQLSLNRSSALEMEIQELFPLDNMMYYRNGKRSHFFLILFKIKQKRNGFTIKYPDVQTRCFQSERERRIKYLQNVILENYLIDSRLQLYRTSEEQSPLEIQSEQLKEEEKEIFQRLFS